MKQEEILQINAVFSETSTDAERMTDRKVVVTAVDKAAFDAMDKSDLPVVIKKAAKPAKKSMKKKSSKKK